MTVHELEVVRRWVGDSKSWLSHFLKRVASDNSIVAIVTMGSAVRDRGHRRSDFDLLVLYRGKRPRLHAPMEVDVRLYPLEKAEHLVARGHEVVCWAVKFGYAVYDPMGAWQSICNLWRDKIPMPSAEDALDRGNRSYRRAKEMLNVGDESAASDLMLAALTQFVRHRLIANQIYPASRPELPDQLRSIVPSDPLAQLLDDAMFDDPPSTDLIARLEAIQARSLRL